MGPNRPDRSQAARRRLLARATAALCAVVVAAAVTGCGGGGAHPAQASSTPAPHSASSASPAAPKPVAPVVGSPVTLSRGCADPQFGNAEVIQTVDAARGYVYDAWIGCGRAAFARSLDGGRHFGAPITLPGSTPQGTTNLSDGPAVAVAPDGTVYATFTMLDGHLPVPNRMYAEVDVSTDNGASFSRQQQVSPPGGGNFADRPYVAVDARGAAYVTWDYSPRAASLVVAGAEGGSGYFKAGDINLVVQKSTDQGRNWSPVQNLSKGAPLGKIITEPDGRIDVLYEGHHVSTDGRYTLSQGQEYFTSSADGGAHWSAPVEVGPQAGSIDLDAWWIDSALTVDPTGVLYASWDTQVGGHDESWLSSSTDRGGHWSAPVRVTEDTPQQAHILDLASGRPGVVYVAWLTGGYGHPYATYLRPWSANHGWLSAPIQLSTVAGDPQAWPGDTVGVSVLPTGDTGATAGSAAGDRVLVSWGSAPPQTAGTPASRIYFATVTFASVTG